MKNIMGYMEQQIPIMPDNYTPELWNASSNDFKPTQTTKTNYASNAYSTDFWNASNEAYKTRNNVNTDNNNGYYWSKNQTESNSDRQYNSDGTKSATESFYDEQESPDRSLQTPKRGHDDESEEELVDQVIETSNGHVFNLSSQQNPQMKYDFKTEKTDGAAEAGKVIKTEATSHAPDTPDANYWTQFMVEYDRALTDSSSKTSPGRQHEDMYIHSQANVEVTSKSSFSHDRDNNIASEEKDYSSTIATSNDGTNNSLYSMFDYPNMERTGEKGSEYPPRKRPKEDIYGNSQVVPEANAISSFSNDKNTDAANKTFAGSISAAQDNSANSLYQLYNYANVKNLATQRNTDNESIASNSQSFADRTAKSSFINYKDIKIESKMFPDTAITKNEDSTKSMYKSFDYSGVENGTEADSKYLLRIRQLEEENGVLESKLKEMKQFCNTLSDDYNEKLGLAKNQMESWLNMWNDVEKTLKDENNKHVGEISQLKEIIETLQKDNSKLSEVNNFLSQGNVENERKKSGTPEMDAQTSGRYKEIVQRKVAEISQLKLVNERLSKDNALLTQKGKGVEEHMANKANLESKLQEAHKNEEAKQKRVMELEAQLREQQKNGANKLQLMVLKEKNKIQDVKLKEFQSLIQNQDFKINVLSSKLAIYKHRNDKINMKDDPISNDASKDDYSTSNGVYFKAAQPSGSEQSSKFRSVTEFIDIDVDVD